MNLVVPVILKADLPLEVWHANFGWNFRVGHVVTFQVLLPLVFLAQRSLAVLNFAVQVWKYLTLVNVCFGMIKLTLKVPNRVADIGITKCILLALGLDPLKVFLSILLQLNLSFFFTSETKDFFWNNRIKLKCLTHLIASWASRKSRRYRKEENVMSRLVMRRNWFSHARHFVRNLFTSALNLNEFRMKKAVNLFKCLLRSKFLTIKRH